MTIRTDIHITPLGRIRTRTLKGMWLLGLIGLTAAPKPLELDDLQLERLVALASRHGVRVERL